MKFVVSSTELLGHLQAISRVISSKNTLPILDNFLFNLSGNDLEITASDLESTLITRMKLENTQGDGTIAMPARILLDTLKEFAAQPLTFDINPDTLAVVISSENGKFNIVGQNGIDFPALPAIKKDKKFSFTINADVMLAGINKTLFATADDELRPVMGGIFVEASTDKITFVASDAHKLVKELKGPFDFVFSDADKEWYKNYFIDIDPKLKVGGCFTAHNIYERGRRGYGGYGGYWGGEIAGARYTRYLVPEVATIYVPDHGRARLLRDARLRRATLETGTRDAPVLIYRPFWTETPPDIAEQPGADLVHPVLAYADLVATAEPRNLQVARQLYDEYIAQYCGEA